MLRSHKTFVMLMTLHCHLAMTSVPKLTGIYHSLDYTQYEQDRVTLEVIHQKEMSKINLS